MGYSPWGRKESDTTERFHFHFRLHFQSSYMRVCSVADSSTPWTVARQAPLSVKFSRQEWWRALPFLTSGNRANPNTGTDN